MRLDPEIDQLHELQATLPADPAEATAEDARAIVFALGLLRDLQAGHTAALACRHTVTAPAADYLLSKSEVLTAQTRFFVGYGGKVGVR